MSEVPEGTITDVLCWVDDDPGRAREALEAERAGSGRRTLITQLEAIARGEEQPEGSEPEPEPEGSEIESGGSETGGEDAEVEGEDAEVSSNLYADVPPPDVKLDLSDEALMVGKLHLRDPDVDVPDGTELHPSEDPWPIVGSQTLYFQVVGGTNGLALVVNGAGYLFNTQQMIALAATVSRAIAL